MKQRHIFIFIISFLIFSKNSIAQVQQDSAKVKEKYGLRVGIDISKPIMTIFDKDQKGLEIVGDYRILRNYYAAVELGYEDKTTDENYMNFTTKGSYIKMGVNFNAYKNWIGMNNEIYLGARYGLSFFSQTLNSYSPNVYGDYIEADLKKVNTEFKSLNAHWAEFIFGIKVETFKNLFLGASAQFKMLISSKEPKNFKNMYVPGFNRVYSNDLGAGFNYTISYLIPLVKKDR